MKLRILPVITAILAVACSSQPKSALHPEWTYDAVVYEVNVRQFSPEGTFGAVEAQLPRLKDLGVDILWLMPTYPIGVEGRKGTLGSYYAISDYQAVNPEFGTMEDFESLVAAVHAQGMRIVLDWVANHTSPDHVWLQEKPAGFYERDAEGNTVYDYDWSDTRNLNYGDRGLWEAQEEAMRFWLEKGVDGFRCDAAAEVPTAFWKRVLAHLRADYPDIYLLAEAETKALADPRKAFDAYYGWQLHHLLNEVAQGKKTAEDMQDYLTRSARHAPYGAFRLSFTSNHDENSWSGSEFEREGAAAQACAVLCFTLPLSQPLIYTGQEIGLSRRLAFFEKDPVTDWTENAYTGFYRKLVQLKHENPALAAGERGGDVTYLEAPEGVLAFRRSVPGNRVLVVVYFGTAPEATEGDDFFPFRNLEADPAAIRLPLDGRYTDLFTGEVFEGEFQASLAPGGYRVLTAE